MLGRQLAQILDGLRRVHLDPRRLGHEVDHAYPAPRLGKVVHQLDIGTVDGDHGGAGGVDRGLSDETLGGLDHLAVVGERLVQLHHRELGVVASADALVAEDASDLEHALHTADDESLEVQFECDP
ncbi:unannotated protein [freshwater metagenome]|uniref:Unannotated protein n=1 Tax=freshwater metagenome TaxID=449393 RepID=A0A6J7C5D8_9ZZZZ